MNSFVRRGGPFRGNVLALAWGIWAFSGLGEMAYGGDSLYPGSYGFGLSCHLGNGYGGRGVGVGPFGGYPYYGGPGYPHPAPCLRRCGQEPPFLYYGGPGYPSYGAPNYFAGVGPLVVDPPVVEDSDGRDRSHGGNYGAYTGVLPYPETYFAPYSSVDMAPTSSGRTRPSSPSPSSSRAVPATGIRRVSAPLGQPPARPARTH